MPSVTFGTPEILAPRVPWPGTRITGVMLLGDALVFRADAGVAPGIYVQDLHGEHLEPRILFRDPPGAYHVNPVAAGPLIAVHRGYSGRIPPVTEEIIFVYQGAEVLALSGQSLGVSGDGTVAVVADVRGKRLLRVDLRARTSQVVTSFTAKMHLHLAPAIWVDHAGTQALFMDARQEIADGSLEHLDLRTGTVTRVREPLAPPGRVCGARSPDGESTVVLEMGMAAGPEFRVLRLRAGAAQTVLSLPLSQPLAVPVFVNPDTIAVPLSLEPYPDAQHGPVDLVAVDLGSGQATPLTRLGQVRGRVRRVDAALVVEGAPAVVRVPLEDVSPGTG